ncbi:SDR family NAD(P)-dependent oxidoreductase [Streptomyces sp. GS7]|uniref:SDR family NAD(P)-dependent oxidoreductase n=1 Tax=Streptomyces sp. GS7 TaxID=2692234 RepID=UPI001318E34B|nr:SDR family oxidoreductase [Streptomyces sp. GS7]QHC23904.1 SDR family NAD(P)-dependent oxidoreductase [Streptomyces sp. GS7]
MTDRPYPYRTALITGASSGIGTALARLLAARGVSLVLVARRESRLRDLAAELRAAHSVEVEVLPADLTDAAQTAQVAARLTDAAKPVELLVNNAGAGATGVFADLPVDREEATLRLNNEAVVRLTRSVLPQMRSAGRGGILNVSSLTGSFPSPSRATYGATKAFLTHFSEDLAIENRGSGIHVTALLPGLTRTEYFTANDVGPAPVPGFLWLTADAVAAAGLRAVAAGRHRCVPGAPYKAVHALLSCTPPPLKRALGRRLSRR